MLCRCDSCDARCGDIDTLTICARLEKKLYLLCLMCYVYREREIRVFCVLCSSKSVHNHFKRFVATVRAR